MRINKRLRALIIFSVIVLLLVGTGIVLKNIFLGQIKKKIQSSFDYTHLHLSFFPPSLVLEDVRACSFSPFFSAKKITVEISYKSLLTRERPFNVFIESPILRLNGTSAKKEEKEKRRFSLSLPFSVEKGLVKGGEFYFSGKEASFQSRGVNALFAQKKDDFSFQAEAEHNIFSLGPTRPQVEGKVSLSIQSRGKEIIIKRIEISSSDFILKAEGSLLDPLNPDLRLKTSLKARASIISDFLRLPFDWEGEAEGEGILTRRLFTRKIIFPGKKVLSDKKLKESLLSLSEGSFFSDEKASKAVEELKEALKKEGYFYPEIKTFTERDPKSSAVDVFFGIQSGKRFAIKKIDFSGEKILPEIQVRKEMQSKEGYVYIPSVFEKDITKLKEIYNSLGYQRAKIDLEEESFNEREGSVYLSLKVAPNEKIKIVVEGAQIPLSHIRPIWEERIFEEWGLAEGEAKIIAYLRKKGYLFSSVTSSIEKVDNEMRVVYKVSPGERFKIKDISFEGLEYFTPSQLKNELGINRRTAFLSWIDGEKLFELPAEIEFLYKTRGFSNTEVTLDFITRRKEVKALIFIEEGVQKKIEKISFEGANLFSQKTLLKQISSFEGGPFYQPTVLKDIEKLENFYLNQGVRGTGIKARVERVSENIFSVVFSLKEGKKVRVEKIVITGNVISKKNIILRELRIKEGDYVFYERIRESKRRLERLGIFTEVKIEEIPLSLDRENLVVKVREGGRNYAGLGGGRKNIPIHERFFAGGSNSFRGEKFDKLEPKDPVSLKPVGGEALFLLNFELTFPLLSAIKDLSGALFYDKGNVFEKGKHFSLAGLQDAVGLGIRYRTPLGPVRLELGWNLDEPRGERKALVFITIGNVF